MKTSRQKVMDVFERKNSGEGVMWTGDPDREIVEAASKAWGIECTNEALFQFFDDDCRRIQADWGYKRGTNPIDTSYGLPPKKSHNEGGCFAEVETVAEIDAYPWPDVNDCDFIDVYNEIDKFQDKMVFTGMWGCFFHQVADFFGMQNYFINMYEAPKLVEAATEHLVDWYVASNEKFFEGLGDRADVMFFGNDFGTQLDLFMSPEMFRKFVLPGFKRIIAVAKKYNKKVLLHSCGSIYRIIPDLIEAGVDAIHPIQAAAAGMSATDLAPFKNDISFVGGIDAQTFFVNSTPDEIAREVDRVRSILGPNIVISPSHERILPNIPIENLRAMAIAAKK